MLRATSHARVSRRTPLCAAPPPPHRFQPLPCDSLGRPRQERTFTPRASISCMTEQQDSGPEGSWVIRHLGSVRSPGHACVWWRAQRPTPTGRAGAPCAAPTRACALVTLCLHRGHGPCARQAQGGCSTPRAVPGSTAGSSSQHWPRPPRPRATGGQGAIKAVCVCAHRAATRECVGVPTCACAHLERLHAHAHTRAHAHSTVQPLKTSFLNRPV